MQFLFLFVVVVVVALVDARVYTCVNAELCVVDDQIAQQSHAQATHSIDTTTESIWHFGFTGTGIFIT